ncbi:protein CBFA2T2-like isoform X2 [Styela clava]
MTKCRRLRSRCRETTGVINTNMPDSPGTRDENHPSLASPGEKSNNDLPADNVSSTEPELPVSRGKKKSPVHCKTENCFYQGISTSRHHTSNARPNSNDSAGAASSTSSTPDAFVTDRNIRSVHSRSGSPLLMQGSSGSSPVVSTSPDSSQSVQRQLSKLKRFLTTLQQFGNDISTDIGETVHYLVYSLVTGTITIESFHDRLQDATNFPLRPFVVPFLKSTLPILQGELLRNAQAAKMTTQQYLLKHDKFLHNSPSPGRQDTRTPDGLMDLKANNKRPHSERNVDLDKKKPRLPPPPPSQISRSSPVSSTSLGEPFGPRSSEVALRSQSHSPHRHSSIPHWLGANGDFATSSHRSSPTLGRIPPRLNPLEDPTSTVAAAASSSSNRNMFGNRRGFNNQPGAHFPGFQPHRMRPYPDPRNPVPLHQGIPQREPSSGRRLSEREWAEEYKSLDYTLNCIVELVEKARHSLLLLHRTHETVIEESSRYRRYYEEGDHFKRRTGDLINETEKRVSQVRKQAEDELIEAKRRLMAELERTVANSESRAHEILAAERGKLEMAITEARRQAEQEVLARLNKQEESHENCWNCGRKAQETCSGCNVARYCGSFCQHKDWENHHKVCGPDLKTRMELSPQKHVQKQPNASEPKRPDSAPESPAPPTSTTDKKKEPSSN